MLQPAVEGIPPNILLWAYAMYNKDKSVPLPVVKLLAEQGGADLCLVKIMGETVLHTAAEDGLVEVLEIFLRIPGVRAKLSSAEHMVTGRGSGSTPLHTAIRCNQMASAKFLIQHGGSQLLLAQDKMNPQVSGCTCLHLAVMFEQCEIISLLCSQGGKELMRLTDKDGQVRERERQRERERGRGRGSEEDEDRGGRSGGPG